MENTVSDYFGCRTPPAKGRKSNSGLLIGIEVELEKVFLNRQPLGWRNEKDGSLKDNGREFTIPVWSNHAVEWLKELFSSLDEAESSTRCSVHVHANVCDFTLTQLKALVLLYTVFERPLYRFSGKRWDSIYCVPVQTWAVDISLDLMDFGHLKNTFPKYSGINIFPDAPRTTLGTVEFRQMVGNKNILYIKTWIDLIVSLVKYAQTKTYEEIKEHIANMRQTSQYWELLQEVFKEHAAVLNYSDFDKDVERGITFAKLIQGN